MFSCREGFSGSDRRSDWREGGYVESFTPYREPSAGKKPKSCLLYIHGFSNDYGEVQEAYNDMAQIQQRKGLQCYGFTWPSEGNLRYYSDLSHCKRSRQALIRVLKHLATKHSSVNIQCHSMGSILTMGAMTEDEWEPGLVRYIYIHGGDASRWQFKRRWRYARVSRKVESVTNMYSEWDRVLSMVSRLMRPVKRIGNGPMPSSAPGNYVSIDVAEWTGEKIRHGDYKSNKLILEATGKWIT